MGRIWALMTHLDGGRIGVLPGALLGVAASRKGAQDLLLQAACSTLSTASHDTIWAVGGSSLPGRPNFPAQAPDMAGHIRDQCPLGDLVTPMQLHRALQASASAQGGPILLGCQTWPPASPTQQHTACNMTLPEVEVGQPPEGCVTQICSLQGTGSPAGPQIRSSMPH